MNILWRIFSALAAVNLIVLAVFVSLVTIQFEAVLSSSIRERLAVIVENVRDPLTSVSDMGLPLSSLRNADAMLERVKQDDEAIEAIHVYDKFGKILHSTVKPHPKFVEPFILSASSNIDGKMNWYLEDDTYYNIGAVIVDLTKDPIGGVAIQYSKDEAVTQVRAMSARLSFYCAIGFFITLLISLPILRMAMNRHIRLFDALLNTFDSFERRFWRTPGGKEQDLTPMSSLGVDSAEFRLLLDQSEDEYIAKKRLYINKNDAVYE